MRSLAAALAFLLAFVSLAVAQVPNGAVGVNYGGDPSVAAGTGTHGSGVYPNYSTFDRIYDANCSTTFHCTWWSTMQPSNTTPTWTGLDALLGALKSAGKIAEYTNSGVPSWVNSVQDLPTGPEQADFQSFISAMFTHIAGNNECFGYYSTWNEVNQPSTYWAGTAATMAALAVGSHSAIKSACPNTVILSPSITAGTDSGSSPNPNGPFQYLDAFLSTCNVGCVDGVNIHGYPMGFFAQTSQPTNQLAPELLANSITNAQALAAKYGLPSAIYIDEGYAESDPSSTTVPANTVAYAAAQADQILLAASMGVSTYANSFFGDGCTSQISCGNEFANGRPLNGTYALLAKRIVGSWLAGATFTNPITRTVGSNLITQAPNDASTATGNLGGSGTGCPSPPAGTGSLPSTWALSASASITGGMSYYVAGKGTSGGLGYLDFRECGTDASGANSDLIRMDNFTAGATVGQQVVLQICPALKAGSLAGIQEVDLQINEYLNSSTYNSQFGSLGQIQPVSTASAAVGAQCYQFRYTVQGATTTLVEPYLVVKHYGSVAIDATFEIAGTIENVNSTLWSSTMTKAGGYSALVAWNPVKSSVTAPSGSVDYRDTFGNVHPTSGGASIPLIAGWPILIENAQQKAWLPVVVASTGGETFSPLLLGGGGFVRGIDIAPDGTEVSRTDTYGGYWWNGSKWVQLVSASSLPSGDSANSSTACINAPVTGCGVYELQIAPGDTNTAYMSYYGNVYVTHNLKSAPNLTWTKTNFPQCTGCGPNLGNTQSGPHIAIDPANAASVVAGLVGTGIYRSTDSGTTVTAISGITAPTGSDGSGYLALFDPSTTSGGSTPGVYIASNGTGVYHSNTGPSGTFTLTSGTPTAHQFMTIGPDGELYYVASSGGQTLHLYNGSAWSTQTLPSNGNALAGIALDPAHPTFASNAHLTAIAAGGQTTYTSNSGGTWSNYSNTTRTCTGDVPWLCVTNETYMTTGQIAYDPTQSNELYFSEGIGVWKWTPSTSGTAAWNSTTKGIEQLVSNDSVSIPSGGPFCGEFWDRPVFCSQSFTANTAYPTQHGLSYTTAIILSNSIDYAKTNPSTLFAQADWSSGAEDTGVSTNSGGTTGAPSNWTACASTPSGTLGTVSNGGPGWAGGVAAVTPSIFLWALTDDAGLFYTLDGCGSWTIFQPSGVASTGAQGWGHAYYNNRQPVCADASGDAYAYNAGSHGSSSTSSPGIYKALFSGGALTYSGRTFAGNIDAGDGFNLIMRCVPGVAGEMFITSGVQTPGPYPHTQSFWDCVDSAPGSSGGTITCTAVPNVKEVAAYGFGKAKPGGSGYPSLYMLGWLSGVYGEYRSDDHASTWKLLTTAGTNPCGSLDEVKTLSGDLNTWNVSYTGYNGSSFCKGVAN